MGSALRLWQWLVLTLCPDMGQICPPSLAKTRSAMRLVLPGYLPARHKLTAVRLTPKRRATSVQEVCATAALSSSSHEGWLHMEHHAPVAVGDGFFRTVIAGGIGAFGRFFK